MTFLIFSNAEVYQSFFLKPFDNTRIIIEIIIEAS